MMNTMKQDLTDLAAAEKELTIVAEASVARARAAARSEQAAASDLAAASKRAADTRTAALVDLTARDTARATLATLAAVTASLD